MLSLIILLRQVAHENMTARLEAVAADATAEAKATAEATAEMHTAIDDEARYFYPQSSCCEWLSNSCSSIKGGVGAGGPWRRPGRCRRARPSPTSGWKWQSGPRAALSSPPAAAAATGGDALVAVVATPAFSRKYSRLMCGAGQRHEAHTFTAFEHHKWYSFVRSG